MSARKLDLNQIPAEWAYLVKGAYMAGWHETIRTFQLPYSSLSNMKKAIATQLRENGLETELFYAGSPFNSPEKNLTLFDNTDGFILMMNDALSEINRRSLLAKGIMYISAIDNCRAIQFLKCANSIMPLQNPVKYYVRGRK